VSVYWGKDHPLAFDDYVKARFLPGGKYHAYCYGCRVRCVSENDGMGGAHEGDTQDRTELLAALEENLNTVNNGIIVAWLTM
jgi:hypothetical protein